MFHLCISRHCGARDRQRQESNNAVLESIFHVCSIFTLLIAQANQPSTIRQYNFATKLHKKHQLHKYLVNSTHFYPIYSQNKNRIQTKNLFDDHQTGSPLGREEATRTPDPHVPNVVRYQLRYFSNAFTLSYNLTTLANSQ